MDSLTGTRPPCCYASGAGVTPLTVCELSSAAYVVMICSECSRFI